MPIDYPQINYLAAKFLDAVDEDWCRDPAYNGPYEVVDALKIDLLAEGFLAFIADAMAQLLDAGSERDAVLENETLLDELRKEISGWTRESV